MIQRIQTVYLLIVAIFMVLMMSFSVGHFYTETSVSDMTNLAVIAPDGTMNYAGSVCVGNTERMWQFYSIMDFMSASDFNHPELVGYSCYRKG